jgi:hypothetical protein
MRPSTAPPITIGGEPMTCQVPPRSDAHQSIWLAGVVEACADHLVRLRVPDGRSTKVVDIELSSSIADWLADETPAAMDLNALVQALALRGDIELFARNRRADLDRLIEAIVPAWPGRLAPGALLAIRWGIVDVGDGHVRCTPDDLEVIAGPNALRYWCRETWTLRVAGIEAPNTVHLFGFGELRPPVRGEPCRRVMFTGYDMQASFEILVHPAFALRLAQPDAEDERLVFRGFFGPTGTIVIDRPIEPPDPDNMADEYDYLALGGFARREPDGGFAIEHAFRTRLPIDGPVDLHDVRDGDFICAAPRWRDDAWVLPRPRVSHLTNDVASAAVR